MTADEGAYRDDNLELQNVILNANEESRGYDESSVTLGGGSL